MTPPRTPNPRDRAGRRENKMQRTSGRRALHDPAALRDVRQASIWAKIGRIVFGAGRDDVHEMYFGDRHLDTVDFIRDVYRDDFSLEKKPPPEMRSARRHARYCEPSLRAVRISPRRSVMSGSGTDIVIERFCLFLRLGEALHNDPWEFR
jgi:hypothetical protein